MNEIFQAFEAAVRRIVEDELKKLMTTEVVASALTGGLQTQIANEVEIQLDAFFDNSFPGRVNDVVRDMRFDVDVSVR